MKRKRSNTARLAVLGASWLVAQQLAAAHIEEMEIVAARDYTRLETVNTLVAPADTAQLLKQMPGADVNRNGELTSLVQYRGMHGARVNIHINEAPISSSGPNAMDAPLHYAPVGLLQSLTVHRGIVPVSEGQETIGGSITAETYGGEFGHTRDFALGGRFYAGAQSVNDGNVLSGVVNLANRQHYLGATLMREEARDARLGEGGRLRPGGYEREHYTLSYGHRRGAHEVELKWVRNLTGNAGTPALTMDIRSVDSDLWELAYRFEGLERSLDLSFYQHDLDHTMSNFHMRRPPQDSMMAPDTMRYRWGEATSDGFGFRVKLEQEVDNGRWRIGSDGHYSEHDTRISNPHMPGFIIHNVNDNQRDITGLYIEREVDELGNLSLHSGLRVNWVEMQADSAAVQLNPMGASGMPAMMQSQAMTLANAYNHAELSQRDTNVDAFARLNLPLNEEWLAYAGIARKSRSPSYQERFLWLPLEVSGGLADGNTYIGDPNLKPEVAHEIELGLDWEHADWLLSPRLFYRQVDDYITGEVVPDGLAADFAVGMGHMGMGSGKLLRFANHDAEIYGLDVEAAWDLGPRLQLTAMLTIVRGELRHHDESLYRLAPDNLHLSLDYLGNGWGVALQGQFTAQQDRVAHWLGETSSAGYSVFNLTSRWQLGRGELGLGIDNLFDRYYSDHLSGYNRASNQDLAMGVRIPGLGRNLYARYVLEF